MTGPRVEGPVRIDRIDRAVCRLVRGPAEMTEHHRIRHAVFVTEQAVFDTTDLDAHDARADVLRVVAWIGGQAAGTVRLFPRDTADPAGGDPSPGLWQGDRLAVLPPFRTAGVGAPLVRYAVATAAARGGTRMIAHVQTANRRFFERLGWTARAAELYAGRPHVAMDIDLRRTV